MLKGQLPNQAHFEFDDNKHDGEAEVLLSRKEIGLIHSIADNPKAEFDVSIVDRAGNEQLVKKGCKNPTGRWGERVNFPLTDDYYRVRVSNAREVKSLDLFLE